MNSVATNCIDDIVARVNTVPSLRDRVFHVYSGEELVERTKGIKFPCAGIVYDGMMGGQEERGVTGKMGSSANLIVSIMVFFRQDTRATDDPKDAIINLLDEIRGKILLTRAPGGHFWKFQMEVAVEGKQGLLTYIQRWATPVQLTA